MLQALSSLLRPSPCLLDLIEIKVSAWHLADGHGLGFLLVLSWPYHTAVILAFW